MPHISSSSLSLLVPGAARALAHPRSAVDASPNLPRTELWRSEAQCRDLPRDRLIDDVVARTLRAQLAMPVGDELVDLLPHAVDCLAHRAVRPHRIEPEQTLQTLAGQIQRVSHSQNMTEHRGAVTLFTRTRAD